MKEELAEMRTMQDQVGSKLDKEVSKRKKAERDVEKLKAQLAFVKRISLMTRDRKMVKVFHFETRLVEEHFEMIHYVENGKKPQWGYFPKAGHP